MSLANESVLLVEDDPNDVILVQRTFTRFALARPIQVVANGELAISYLEGRGSFGNRDEHPLPTLMFLDLKLPDISGFEVLTWARQQPQLAQTQIVVLTGSKKSLDVYRAYELGANSYLVKPVQAQDIAGLAQSLKLPWLALAEPSALEVQAPIANTPTRPFVN